MPAVVERACAQCGRKHAEGALVCGLCGHVLRRKRSSAPRVETAEVIGPELDEHAGARERREPWLYLAGGLLAAPVLAWTPILSFMGWFLAALVHEMGHAAMAWLCGMPSIPAISPGGHAAAVHGPQIAALALAITAGFAFAAWRVLAGTARWIALAVVGIGHPLLAFTGAKELGFLLAGHGAELLFATLCLWKALDGGFTSSRLERGLYAMLGWYLVGVNASLCLGLVRSGAARARYRSGGSFGLTNDYVRAAEDVLGWNLASVGAWMLVATVLVVPLTLVAWRSSRARA